MMTQANAQQDPQYSQYIFNGLILNPAYAGSKEHLNANAIYRTQWTGLEGSPKTQTASVDKMAFRNVGLGFHVVNDCIGAERNLSFYGSYAYKLRFESNVKLSLGIAGGVSNYSVDESLLKTDNPYDPDVQKLANSKILPDAKTGVFFNTERYYAGVSVSNILSDLFSYESSLGKPKKHYYLTTGYLWNITPGFAFKPSILLKESFDGPGNLDLNGFVLINDKLWLGSSYRTGSGLFYLGNSNFNFRNAVALMMEYYFNEFRIGYVYDITTSGLNGYSTHEISLGYYFVKKHESKMLVPRYF